MQKVARHIFVPFTSKQMYDLVNNIESYPEFLEWCASSDVQSRSEHEVVASLELKWGSISKSFTTKNHLEPYSKITLSLLEGPFKHLSGVWSFEDIEGGGCKVSVDIEFEFSNSMIATLFSPAFSKLSETLIDRFHERAKVVYGDNQWK